MEINKTEKATTGVDRTIETTIIEIKADHMTGVLIAPNTIP